MSSKMHATCNNDQHTHFTTQTSRTPQILHLSTCFQLVVYLIGLERVRNTSEQNCLTDELICIRHKQVTEVKQ